MGKKKIITKNMARTATTQLEGRHLLFGEYLRSWTKDELNIDESMEVSMF